MPERGKSEESQRTEADDPDALVDEMLSAVREAMQRLGAAKFLPRSRGVDFHLHSAGEDPSDVDIDVKVAPSGVKVSALQELGEVASRVNRPWTDLLSELDAPVERDDAYYDEVRQAVGRGAPSVLLGTSTKSLERSLREQRAVSESHSAPSTSSEAAEKTEPSEKAKPQGEKQYTLSSKWIRRNVKR